VQKSFLNILLLAVACVWAGCDRPEPTSYRIPKEDRSVETPRPVAAPAPTAPVANGGDGNNMRVLPGMAEAADAAGEFTYDVPASWEEFPPEGIRKANFRVASDAGEALVTVTVFPGDVGGKLGNINRWRSQIGLDPIDLQQMREVVRPFPISNHNGMLVSLHGPSESVLGGILGHHGFTWFFKMQGPPGIVAEQVEAMEQFLASVQIEDDHH